MTLARHRDGPSIYPTPTSVVPYNVRTTDTTCAAADSPTPHLLRQASTLGEVFFHVTDGGFRWIWAALLLSYAFVATMHTAFAVVYVFLLLSPQAYYYADMFRTISVDLFPLVILAYATMAFVYVARIVRVVTSSLRSRRLVFSLGTPSPTSIHPEQSASSLLQPRSRASRPLHAIRRTYRLLFSSQGVLGVRGRFFDTVTLLREVVEIAVQVAQAYTYSSHTANAWINVTFAALLVLNCFASPLLLLYGRASSGGVRRLVILIVDLLFDVFWSVVLPFAFLLPYIARIGGPEAVFFQDTFIARALMELPMIFVTSLGDLLVKLLPTTSLFFTLRKFEYLIQRNPGTASRSRQTSADLLKRQLSSFSSMLQTRSGLLKQLQSVGHRPSAAIRGQNPKTASMVRALSFRRTTWLQSLLLWLMIATGGLVLIATVLAHGVYTPQCPHGCKLLMHPWFVVDASRCDCAVLEINCFERGIDGTASELHDVLVRVTPGTLLALIVTHCRALVMPPALHRFRNLFSLDIFNSTIRDWPNEAAITQRALPRFGYLLLVYTFLTELPTGVYHADLPVSLREVDIVGSNLTTLPLDLYEKWPHVRTLYIDLAQLTAFPTGLSKMTQLETLSLRGNKLQNIPAAALAPLRLSYLLLSENPLVALPTAALVGTNANANATLTQLQIVGTAVTNLEDQSASTVLTHAENGSGSRTIFAKGSPLCGSAQALAPVGWRIECERMYMTYNGEPSVGYYPLEGKLKERRPR